MKKLLFTLPLIFLGGSIMAQQGLKKAERVESSQVEYPKAKKATPASSQGFNERAFIEEYLIGSELPESFPEREVYSDEKEFMRDVKLWVRENPQLVYEHKRIK